MKRSVESKYQRGEIVSIWKQGLGKKLAQIISIELVEIYPVTYKWAYLCEVLKSKSDKPTAWIWEENIY